MKKKAFILVITIVVISTLIICTYLMKGKKDIKLQESTQQDTVQQDILELVSLLTNEENSEFGNEFYKAYTNPNQYVTDNKEVFEEWFIESIDEGNKEIAMIALYNYMKNKNKAGYIDWAESSDYIVEIINNILSANGYPQFEITDKLDEGLVISSEYINEDSEKYMSVEEILNYCSERLKEVNVTLISLDIDNDAYEIIAIPKDNLAKIQELGKSLGYTFSLD